MTKKELSCSINLNNNVHSFSTSGSQLGEISSRGTYGNIWRHLCSLHQRLHGAQVGAISHVQISPLPTVWECSFILLPFHLSLGKETWKPQISFTWIISFVILPFKAQRWLGKWKRRWAIVPVCYGYFFLAKGERLSGQSVSEKVEVLIHSRYLFGL